MLSKAWSLNILLEFTNLSLSSSRFLFPLEFSTAQPPTNKRTPLPQIIANMPLVALGVADLFNFVDYSKTSLASMRLHRQSPSMIHPADFLAPVSAAAVAFNPTFWK